MPKKKQLTIDSTTGQLSRLNEKDLPLVSIDGLSDGDILAPFGTLTSDIIEYCIYDTSDNYLASAELKHPFSDNLDVGSHIRGLGYERGTYKIVYNFLREIGGSSKFILTKKSDKSIYTGDYMLEPNGKIFASYNLEADLKARLLDDHGNDIELFVQDDKFWIHEISPSRTEIRLRPNPAIVDVDHFEKFRLLGFTCLSYSDVSGESNITFSGDGKTATINGGSITLQNAMEGGTLKIRDAFVIDYEESDEQITRYTPVVDTELIPAIQNLVTNGHFSGGENVVEFTKKASSTEIVQDFPNPGHSRYSLKSDGSMDETNDYWIQLRGTPGESYILSCWVHWTDDWLAHKLLFRGSTASGGTPRTFDDTNRGVAETKEIDGKLWQRFYKNITIPTTSTDGSMVLWLGHTNENTNYDVGAYRYITDIQIEAGGVSGEPSPFTVKERVEEEDSPTTGLITFIDDNKVEAVFSDEDSGFSELMASDGDSRGSGILTIKDAYVTDQTYTQNEELIVIDEIPLKNPDASDIRKGEREFRVSPYHGTGTANRIWIRVDNNFTITSFNSLNVPTVIGSSFGVAGAYKESYNYPLPDNLARLEILTRNNTKGAGFIATIKWNGTEIRTGEGQGSYSDSEEDWKRDNYGGSHEIDVPRVIRTSTNSSGPFQIISNSTDAEDLNWTEIHGKKTNVHEKLRKSDWVWSTETKESQDLVWEWTPEGTVTDVIWQFPDPILNSDAVHPRGWSDGFNSFNWGGIEERKTQKSRWHSGWLGHHAKWVDGDGEYGGVAMKLIDQNSAFGSPNHIDYVGEHKTAFNEDPDQPSTLAHRWLGISQTLPHSMAAQGIKPGDQITVSWSQKSDTINKGACVGLHHYNKTNGQPYWGLQDRISGYHHATEEEGSNPAWEYEFRRYRPVSKVGEWERVTWTGIVEDDWDLNKACTIYIYGMYGPEGIVWVENVQVQITEFDATVDTSPTTADFVGQIIEVEGDTAILSDTYQGSAPDGAVLDNEVNIQPFSTFTSFFVDYTSSLAESTPTYGSLRGDIESIIDNNITLVNTYAELGEQEGHDFNNTLGVDQNITFNKWFIQYPNDNQNDLSKLLKLGPNDFSLITNFKYDTQEYPEYPHSLVYKLYEPLPEKVQSHDFITVVREMIPPVEETCILIPFVEEFVSDIVLRTPEFGGTTSPIGPGQTEFKNYNQLVSSNAEIQDNIENELLSGSLSADINVDFNLFENFIHFSSAEQRLKNFKYKLDLIEQYTDRSASLAGTNSGSSGLRGGHRVKADPGAGSYLLVSGTTSYSPSFTPISGSLTQIQYWETQRRETVNNFDKFEKYMFNQSSSFSSESIGLFHDNSWPKESGTGTYSSPYINYRTSQSVATTWYADQLISASAYDKANKNRLKSHLPMFVQDDNENDVFLKFIDMIGHHFDDMWVFIKSMTDVHDKRDKLTEGIAKDLLKPVAQSLGWEVHDGKDLISLPRYMFGMEQTGSEKPWEFSGTPERDISREIWSRIVNNMPYFLKTKGTSRAIKGLISCYGIPSSILRVVEYGGPSLPGNSPDHFLTRKFTKALDFFGSSNNTYVETNSWFPVISGSATNRVPDTVEFRFSAATGSNQVLVRRGTDWAIRLKDNGSTDTRGYVSFMLSGSHGYNEVSSSELPVYDGEFWSVMLTRTTGGSAKNLVSSDTGSQNVDYNLFTKKYDAGRSKIIYESTNTLAISGSAGVNSGSYNIAYSGSDTTVTLGGPQHATFGESLSGSMMEYRNWTTALQESSFDNHVSAPIAFDGNTPSASYLDLVTRYSFDDDKDLSVGYNQWFQDVTADQSFTASAVPSGYTTGLANTRGTHFSSVVDETKMKVPNLGPSGRSSNKIRIEADERIDKVGNPILKFGKSITIPAYDKSPIDSNKLGVFFSPSAAIDEDIILSMPNLDFDQYIGDPRDQYNEQYTGLTEARNLYWKKYAGPNNFWDYLRLIKYYDSSLYRQIRSLVPARANATVGILIEPTVLERDKIIIGKEPSIEPSHYVTKIVVENEYSESAEYKNYERTINWSNPFGINPHTNTTGSYISASAFHQGYEVNLNFVNEFDVNWYTLQSGSSQPKGLVSSSAMELTPWGLNTMPLNMYDPHRVSNRTRLSGSGVVFTADLVSYNAPSNTFSELAAGTGSFVLKHILERPAIYNVGDKDDSGWYGTDYSGSTFQFGSTKTIFEEVVMPRIDTNVLSRFNDEIEYFYGNAYSASNHIPNSSSFVRSDLDNKWDEAIGTDRLFYVGCVQSDTSTVADNGGNYDDNTPAVDIVLVSPTKLVTSDTPNTQMDVTNK